MIRKCSLTLCVLLVITAFLLSAGPSRAGDVDSIKNFGLKAVIKLPGIQKVQRFDIGWVDHPSQTYYLADRTNKQIDVIDARTDKFVQALAHGHFVGFTGNNDTSGPNGILVIQSSHELWAGDGPSHDPVCSVSPCSTVKVIDLKATPPEIVATISTGGMARADEMAFDPDDHILVVANDADDPPYLTFISTDTRKVLGTLAFHDADNGLEQSVWDSATRRFYLNVPNTGGDSYIAQIDPRTRTITNKFHVDTCEGAGLDITPHQHLIVGCQTQETLVVDARTGTIVALTTQVGGSDQVWFNPGDDNYYLAARDNASGPVLGIIDAATNIVLGTVRTGARGVHSVAANRANNHVFVPLPPGSATGSFSCPNGCIGVYFSGE
jgi:DNA-binding beta-propeller fold protein YncE